MLNRQQVKRLNELYEQAVSRYLDKTDFNASDWLDDDVRLEFCELVNIDTNEGRN